MFTGLVLLVSIIHADRFFFGRPLAWVWFTLLPCFPCTPDMRCGLTVDCEAAGDAAPGWLLVALAPSAVLMGVYGLGLLVAPVTQLRELRVGGTVDLGWRVRMRRPAGLGDGRGVPEAGTSAPRVRIESASNPDA